jgi:pimeloyl-ACP methyl ester carboxylesterase
VTVAPSRAALRRGASAPVGIQKDLCVARTRDGVPLSLVRKRVAGTSRGAVVLVHGYAQNRYSWHLPQRSLTDHLAAAGFDVFNLELRGVGRSRALGAPPARAVADFAAQDLPAALDAVRAATGDDRPFLVGHSLGALVALAAAGRTPERVRGVVSLAGIYDFARGNALLRAAGRALTLLPGGGRPHARVPTDAVGRALHAARALFDARAAERLPLQAWAPGSMAPEVLAEAVRRSFEAASRGVTRDLARLATGQPLVDAAGAPLLAPWERQRSVPLLVVAGAEDVLVSPQDARAACDRAATPDRTFVTPHRAPGEPGWGHMDLLLGDRAPERVWPLVTAWLAAR